MAKCPLVDDAVVVRVVEKGGGDPWFRNKPAADVDPADLWD